ncbi:MAG: glycosyltransferase family 39 protein [Planctomycetes bacterium]|nr:glycosyltransferase family 39 protein [Planctomycetota bacterium]
MRKFSWILTPIPCALLFCLANAVKPAVIDDLAYLWFIPPILQNPAQPFGPPPDGFWLIWYDRGQGAFSLLTPMVVPYWLSIGAALFGQNLVLLKFWLFPFCLLLTWALTALFHRFSPVYVKPLLAMTVFSPVLLPSLNVMVDVPALALNLAAITIFLKALDGEQPCWGLLVFAGLLAGLAAQTKYTGATSVIVILLHGLQRRRFREGLLPFAIALGVFVGWEAYLTQVYGQSHFLLQTERRRQKPPDAVNQSASERIKTEILSTLAKKADLAVPMIGNLGGVTPGLILLTLAALRFRRRVVWSAAGLFIAEFLILAFVPDSWAIFGRNPQRARDEISLGTIFMGVNGVLFVLLMIGVLLSSGRFDRFLLLWLAVELFATFALSPFTAARRVMGIVIVSTLLIGRLLNRTVTISEPEASARDGASLADASGSVEKVAYFTVLLGCLFAWTDYRDAQVEKNAAVDSVAWIRAQPVGNHRIWFTGHWGFQYYATLQGAFPIFPGESAPDEGDWIIYPDTTLRPYAQLIVLEPEWAERQITFEWSDPWPFRTNPEFYDGFQPIRHHEGHRIRVTIFRVKKKFLAQPL